MVKVIPAAKTSRSTTTTKPNVFPSLFILQTSCVRSRRQAMAAHDLCQLYSVRRTTSGRFDYRRRLAEILRTHFGGGNHHTTPRPLAYPVIRTAAFPTRNAKR